MILISLTFLIYCPLGYYSKFASPKLYLCFGDMIEQDEFNASAFLAHNGLRPIPEEYKNFVEVLHVMNVIYFYSLAKYIMTYLAGKHYLF